MLSKPAPAMMQISVFAILAMISMLAGAAPSAADGQRAAIVRNVPSAELVGKGRMTYLGFRLFDAELYAPEGTYRASAPFALKLTYLRAFKSEDIVESSLKEIRRQGGASAGQLDRWETEMRNLFPDVAKGQSITGVRTQQGEAEFYLNGRKLGSIGDADFSRKFFAIWLGRQTRNPQLRAALTGS